MDQSILSQDTIVARDQSGEKIKVILISDFSSQFILRNLFQIEPEFNDNKVQTVDFYISRIILPDNSKQRIYLWVAQTKNILQVKPFLSQCHLYIIAFSTSDLNSFTTCLEVWFPACLNNSRKNKAFYYFLPTQTTNERVHGNYTNIIDAIQNAYDQFQNIQKKELTPFDSNNYKDYAAAVLSDNIFYAEISEYENLGVHNMVKTYQHIITDRIEKIKLKKPAVVMKQLMESQEEEEQEEKNDQKKQVSNETMMDLKAKQTTRCFQNGCV